MVETNHPNATQVLQEIVNKSCRSKWRRKAFNGHAAEYSPFVDALRERVRKNPPKPRELLRRKKYWHPDFHVELVNSLEEHNYKFAINIYKRLAEHTSQSRPVIWVTPVGPVGQYPVLAELMNKLGGINPKLIYPFAMDEKSSAKLGFSF